MITAADLTLRLGGRCILADVHLKLDRGEVLALCGPNGAGKSSLLACLAGEHAATLSAVTYDGVPLSQLAASDLARHRVVLEQAPSLSADFTVEELVELGAPLALPHAELDRLIVEVLAELGLVDLRGRSVLTLSGGQQHRAHLARVLVQLRSNQWLGHDCAVFLDEPTASLDLAHQIRVMTMSRALAQDGVGVIVVLHDLNLAAAFADRVLLMREGRVVSTGAPETVFTSAALSEVYETPVFVERSTTGQIVIQPLLKAYDAAS